MVRFMRKGITKVRFVPTITVLTAPTTAQITAGTDLTGSIAAIDGFSFANSPIDTPDMGSTFVSKINGEDTADTSSITFYEDSVTTTIETALPKAAIGYICIFRRGTAGASPAAGDKMQVWPVTVASNSSQYTAGNEAAQFQVVFSNTAAPVEATQAA